MATKSKKKSGGSDLPPPPSSPPPEDEPVSKPKKSPAATKSPKTKSGAKSEPTEEWKRAEAKRKVEEEARIRAFQEMKLREEELKNISYTDDKSGAADKTAALEAKRKEIMELQAAAQAARDKAVLDNADKKKKHYSAVSKAAFKKMDETVAKRPDVGAARKKAIAKAKGGGGDDDDSDNSDYET